MSVHSPTRHACQGAHCFAFRALMHDGIHFIAGLPRSGSTLLAALLRQNPRFWAGMTSPVGSLFSAMLRETSQRNETSVFVDDDLRQRLLRAIFEAYYAEIHPAKVVFDTNRIWTTKMPALTRLFPSAKFICCVRNPAWVVDSIESLIRLNAFELSGIFSYEPGGTVYSRAESLGGGTGMVGFAFNALREAVYGEFADRLLLVRYESLTANPIGTMAAIYNFVGQPQFAHDPDHIEPWHDLAEFDRRLGTPGLHDVGSSVHARMRPTVLPPDLFKRYGQDAFWNDPAEMPSTVRLV